MKGLTLFAVHTLGFGIFQDKYKDILGPVDKSITIQLIVSCVLGDIG